MKIRTLTTILAVIAAIFCLFTACEAPTGITTATVTFETNGGSSVGKQTVISGSTAVRPEAPTRDGYVFDNWYSDSGLTALYDFNNSVTGDITLYAKWIPISGIYYTVTFNSNGGTEVASQQVLAGDNITRPENPTREGFTFNYWYDTSGLPYDLNAPVFGNITLYALWNEIPGTVYYIVHFETNGGSSIPDLEVAENSHLNPPLNPMREGFTFDDWYSDSSLTVLYDFSIPVTGNITLYAQWNISQYTVIFDSMGGSEIPSQTVLHGDTITRPADPTRDGFTFDNWYTYLEELVLYDFTNPVYSDITLYAQWNEIPGITYYNVYFNTNGGSAIPVLEVMENGTAVHPANPTKEGYTFDCWSRTNYWPSNNEPYDFSDPVTDNITLYAHWLVNRTVTFDSDGGSEVPSQTVPDGGTVARPADPTRAGYTFEHWYEWNWDPPGKPYDFDNPVTRSIYLRAVWLTNPTVTFNSNGGSAVSSQNVPLGSTATRPSNPTRDGYTFDNWYSDSSLTTVYNFSNSVTSNTTLYAKWNVNIPITNRDALVSYLSAQPSNTSTNPVSLVLDMQLTNANWNAILSALSRYVDLDLSLCTRSDSDYGGGLRSDGTFDPGPGSSSTGKSRIISIMLPDAATAIVDGTSDWFNAFVDFTNIRSASGKNITRIGDAAFMKRDSLTSVDFPAVTEIGNGVFGFCTNLISVNIPKITSIGSSVFGYTENTPLTITMGSTAPTLGTSIFYSVPTKSVTVRVPEGATGYGSGPNYSIGQWIPGFMGMGWDGTDIIIMTYNAQAVITIQEY